MYPATTGTGFARCVPPIHQLHRTTVLLSLVEHLTLDLKETGIADRLRYVMVGKHSFRVEVFQAYQAIGSGNICRHLVQAILTLSCYAIVGLGQLLGMLPPVLAALYFAREALA